SGPHPERAVDHVHAAGEAKPACAVWRELHRGLRVGGKRSVLGEVGKHHAGSALATLLTVEQHPQGNALAHADQVRRVAALDDDGDLLELARHLRRPGLPGAKKEPSKPCSEAPASAHHTKIFHALTSLSPASLSSRTFSEPSPASIASTTQCSVWSLRSASATASRAAFTALTCV